MFKNKNLSSGAKYISINRPDLMSISMVIFIKVGSINELDDEKGMSHFLEHMLFKGSSKYKTPLEITEKLDSLGAVYNAFTDKNMTAYHIKVSQTYCHSAFDVLVDLVTKSLLKEKDMIMEQQVVIEEFNQMMDNPVRSLLESTLQVVFQGQDLQHPIIGYLDNIKSYTNKSLKNYYNKFYNKSNMTIAICGNINQKLDKQVYKHFGKPKKTKKIENPKLDCCDILGYPQTIFNFIGIPKKFKIKQDFKGYVPIVLDKRKSQQSHILISYKIPGIYNNSKWLFVAIKQYLAGTMSSKLFQILREKWGLVYTVSIDILQYDDCGAFCIYAGTETKNCKQVVQLILKEMNDLSSKPIPRKELLKILKYIRGNLTLENDDSMNLAQYYGIQSLYNINIQTIDDLVKNVYIPRKITPGKILKLSKKYFHKKNMIISILGNHSMQECKRFIQ